jgi:Copper type II ascorbate-dependent monooxygenase, C-terminal domain
MPRLARLVLASLALPLAAAAAACSSSSGTSTDGPTTTTPDALSVEYGMKLSVPAGAETHMCKLVTLPGDGGYVGKMEHTYTTGSHHLLLFRTDFKSIAPGLDQPNDCYEGAGGGVMSHVRAILYGSQEAKGENTLPAGIGLRVEPNEVFLLQVHYINPTANALEASVNVKLTLSDPDTVQQRAGVLFFYDPLISVPAGAQAKAGMRCAIKSNITLLTGFSHMHKRGTGFEAFLDSDTGPLAPAPFYTSSDWEHPQGLAAPMPIAAGSRLRFSCNYDNRTGTKAYYQGQSAENDEMCLFSGLYYPEMGAASDFCADDTDMLGTGAKTCQETQECTSKCPLESAPGSLSQENTSVDPCWQKCLVESCPSAWKPYMAQASCAGSKCKTECAAATSAECTTCAVEKCGPQIDACSASTCQ